MKRAAAAVLLLLVLSAAKPVDDPIRFNLSGWQRHSVVEQQSPGGALCKEDCVTNPTDFCPWDPDEAVHVRAFGDMAPGETVTWTGCVIADWSTHLAYVTAGGFRHGELTATIAADNPHREASVTVTGKVMRACILTQDYEPGSALLEPVAGSNGGVGAPTTITVSVTNTGTRRLREVVVGAGIQYPQITDERVYYCGPSPTCVGTTQPGLEPRVCWGIGAAS